MMRDDQQVQVGDKVKLKSGGPSMTVVRLTNHNVGGSVETHADCYWYYPETGDVKTKSIPVVGLKKVQRTGPR